MKRIKYKKCNTAVEYNICGIDFITIDNYNQKVLFTSNGNFIFKKDFMYLDNSNKVRIEIAVISMDFSIKPKLIIGSTHRNNILELSRT